MCIRDRAWGLWIGLGRMYAAMHSLTDVIAGVVVSTITVPILLLCAPLLLRWMHGAPLLAIAAASIGPMLVYPKPLKDTPSFCDAVSFLGAAAGAVLGMRQQAGTAAQPPLDSQNLSHLYLTAIQLVVGVLLAALSKEGVNVIAKPVMGVVLGAAPAWLRARWQPPVHGHQPLAQQDVDVDTDTEDDDGVLTVCPVPWPLLFAMSCKFHRFARRNWAGSKAQNDLCRTVEQSEQPRVTALPHCQAVSLCATGGVKPWTRWCIVGSVVMQLSGSVSLVVPLECSSCLESRELSTVGMLQGDVVASGARANARTHECKFKPTAQHLPRLQPELSPCTKPEHDSLRYTRRKPDTRRTCKRKTPGHPPQE